MCVIFYITMMLCEACMRACHLAPAALLELEAAACCMVVVMTSVMAFMNASWSICTVPFLEPWVLWRVIVSCACTC